MNKGFIWFLIGVPFMLMASIKIVSVSGEWLATGGTLIWMYSAYCLGKSGAVEKEGEQ